MKIQNLVDVCKEEMVRRNHKGRGAQCTSIKYGVRDFVVDFMEVRRCMEIIGEAFTRWERCSNSLETLSNSLVRFVVKMIVIGLG